MGKKLTWDEIDALVWKWCDMPSEGNQAAKKKLENDIFLAVLDRHDASDPQLSALGEFFEQDWPKFRPDDPDAPGHRRSFRTFYQARIKLRAVDVWMEDHGAHVKEGGTEYDLSLDGAFPNEDDSGKRAWEYPIDHGAQDALEDTFADERALACIALILELPHRLRGKANNPVRISFFKLFFTDGVVAYLHRNGGKVFLSHERDLFRAMRLPFLDYVLTDVCRRAEEIMHSDLKPYGELVPGAEMTFVRQPLPLDVYSEYLDRVEQYRAGMTAISQQRTAYRTFMKEHLC